MFRKGINVFDRELMFQMLFNKEWDGLAKILYENSGLIQSDPVINQAIQLFESEYFSDIQDLNPKEKLSALEYPGIVLDLKQKSFSDKFIVRFINEKLQVMQLLNSEGLISFAASHQKNPLAQKILQDIQKRKPELMANERRENVSIKATKIAEGEAKTIRLFKSQQENNFFEAIRLSFPTYHPYPNVALSCIINFDAIQKHLNPAQKNYFFRAVIDSVVFDAINGYQPMYFFELDSHYHDGDKAKENDNMKNKIFEIANVKLIRIRAHEAKETTIKKFQELVLEVMRDL